jgi:disulfide bond formation protein DsbB
MKFKLSKECVSQVVLLSCCGSLMVAWVTQYVFGYQACVFCLYQRYLYIAAIFLLATHLYFFRGRFQGFFLILTSLVLFMNAATAGYQVAIENRWVEVPQICTAPPVSDSFEAFKEMVAAKEPVSCDKVEWSFLGISMAGYNFLLALGLGLISFMGVFVHDRRKKKFTRR